LWEVIFFSAHVAQLVEHILGKDEVTSSTLVVGSMKRRDEEFLQSLKEGLSHVEAEV
jgi:hypothetical protein